jgi:hypothetical protein
VASRESNVVDWPDGPIFIRVRRCLPDLFILAFNFIRFPVICGLYSVCTICTSTSSTHSYLMFAYKSILTVWGIYLAISVRKVSDNFNESKFIGMSIYNAAVASLIVIPVRWYQFIFELCTERLQFD